MGPANGESLRRTGSWKLETDISTAHFLLEVIVQSVADAAEAEAGGADRLEVVREIERDGLTPPLDLVRSIIAATSLPLRVMVRESDGFGITGPRELIALQRAFADLADLGVHGAVVGFARDGALDLDLMASVLAVAPGLPVTLHRAFDSVRIRKRRSTRRSRFPKSTAS